MKATDRRRFLDKEALALATFVDVDIPSPNVARVLGYSREYICDCGFRCVSSRDIWDHCEGAHQEMRDV